MINIYLDENLSEYVADALNSLNKGYFPDVNVYSTKVKFGKGVPDELLIPQIGKHNGILVTKDVNIIRKRLQYQLCKQHNLGIFTVKPSKGMDKHWIIVKMLIENWESIIEKVQNNKPPFAFEISMKGKIKRV